MCVCLHGRGCAGLDKLVAPPSSTPFQEAKESAALAKATISKTTQRLADKVAQMEALTAKYQQAGRCAGALGKGQGEGCLWRLHY